MPSFKVKLEGSADIRRFSADDYDALVALLEQKYGAGCAARHDKTDTLVDSPAALAAAVAACGTKAVTLVVAASPVSAPAAAVAAPPPPTLKAVAAGPSPSERRAVMQRKLEAELAEEELARARAQRVQQKTRPKEEWDLPLPPLPQAPPAREPEDDDGDDDDDDDDSDSDSDSSFSGPCPHDAVSVPWRWDPSMAHAWTDVPSIRSSSAHHSARTWDPHAYETCSSLPSSIRSTATEESLRRGTFQPFCVDEYCY